MEDIEKKKLPKSRKICIIVAIVVLAVIVLSAIIALIVYCSNLVGYRDANTFVAGDGCSDFYYKNLSANQKKLYRTIYKEADDALHSDNHLYTLGVYKYSDYGLTQEDAITVWYALRYDAPSLFVISNSYLSLPDAIAVNVASEFSSKKARQNVLDNLQKSVEQVKALLSGIDDDALKFKIIYDYILDKTYYQTDKDEKEIYNGYTYSIVGALDGDESTGSICQGYARTVSYLCNMFGIECIYVGIESAKHSLNIVNIKGNWYYTDANTEDRFYTLNYNYFLNGYDGFWWQIFKTGTNSSRNFLMNCLPEIEDNPHDREFVNGVLTYKIKNRSNCSIVSCDSGAKSVVIPSNIANMTVRIENALPFSNCEDLESLAVEEDNSLYKSEGNCIITKRTNLLVAGCKNSKIPKYVTTLGAYSFAECKGLISITIPDSVTDIRDRAFDNCSNMDTIFIPSGVTIMGECLFSGCSKLTVCCQVSKRPDGWNVNWGAGYRQVIWSCLGAGITDDGMKWSLTVDREVEIIGYLGESNQVVIPSVIDGYDVKSINSQVFYNRDDLISLYIPSSITRINSTAIYRCRKMVIYCQASQKPDGWELNLNDVGKSVVWNCSTDGYGVTQDGLQWCLPAQSVMTITGYLGSDTQIELPTSINGHIVTRITEYAFRDLDYLISITIPRSVTSIGRFAFFSCDNLSIYCEVESQPDGWEDRWYAGRPVVWNCKNHGITDSGVQWSLTADDVVVITGYIGESNYVEIPSEINGRQVTNIGKNAFNQYDNLTGIFIPLTITVIPEFTFSGCSSLTIYCEAESRPEGWSEDWNHSYWPVVWDCKNNEIADDGYIYYIADNGIRYALKDGEAKVAWQSEMIGGDLVISNSILYKGTSYNVTSIGVNAFSDCKLTGIEIPDSVTSIGARAFSRCINLTNVKIANNVTSIGEQAFESCYALKKIVIPDSVVQIDDNAFRGCFDLTIYCQAESKPSDWVEDWNIAIVDYETQKKSYISVIWGYKGE